MLYTAFFLFKKHCTFCNSHYLVCHKEYLSSSSFNVDCQLNTSKQHRNSIQLKKRLKLFYNHPHLYHKVRKKYLKACVRPLRQHTIVAHKILMFRTVQIQTPLENHSSLSHTMLWVKMRAHISLQTGASFNILQ